MILHKLSRLECSVHRTNSSCFILRQLLLFLNIKDCEKNRDTNVFTQFESMPRCVYWIYTKRKSLVKLQNHTATYTQLPVIQVQKVVLKPLWCINCVKSYFKWSWCAPFTSVSQLTAYHANFFFWAACKTEWFDTVNITACFLHFGLLVLFVHSNVSTRCGQQFKHCLSIKTVKYLPSAVQ